jgi:hypothetical protein
MMDRYLIITVMVTTMAATTMTAIDRYLISTAMGTMMVAMDRYLIITVMVTRWRWR